MNFDINIQVDSPFEDKIDTDLIEQAAKRALVLNMDYRSFELGVVITDDETIHEINKKYRSVDAPTDVISFALLEGKDDFVMPPDNTLHPGEVIISYPRALEQASEHDCSLKRELAWLVVHGVLHLIGYDHDTEQDRHIMQSIEDDILEQMGL